MPRARTDAPDPGPSMRWRKTETEAEKPRGSEPPAKPAVSAAEGQPSGWSCRPGETGKAWDCSLVGPDPRGETHEVGAATTSTEEWLESGDVTAEDERRFRRVVGLLPANPWQNACAGKHEADPMTEFLITPEERARREKLPLDVHSNYFEMIGNELSNFRGSAELQRGDQKLWADFVTHDSVTDTLNAHGEMVYQEKGMTFSGDSGFLDTSTDRGTFRNSQFVLTTVPSRGTARVVHLDSNKLSRYEKFTYTTCPPGNQDWLLHASNVKINKETGRGTATNAWMQFKSVPILYLPYMSFPVDDRRQTGFLTPSFGFAGKNSGFNISVPYYFNLAPNYDATFTPRYLTERGPLFLGEVRYLTEMTRGMMFAEVMPHDEAPLRRNEVRGDLRGQGRFLNDTRFTENLTAHIDANYISDRNYLNDVRSPLSITNASQVTSIGSVTYADSGFSLTTAANYFQLTDPIYQTILKDQKPWYYLPKVQANYTTGLFDTGILATGMVEIANFRNDGDRAMGQRLLVRPKLYYPFQTTYGFFTPSFTLHHSQYWLTNVQENQAKQHSRTIPIFSVDSGLYFDREFKLADTPLVQTIEPRLFYVYIPYQDQTQLPPFDTTEYDFTLYQLFRENRYTGNDRIGDANQLTAALTTRLIDSTTGFERFRGTLGEIFYFQSPRLPLLAGTVLPENRFFSNVVVETTTNITDNWSLRAGGQWNPENNNVARGLVGVQYNDRDNHLFNLAYRYRRDPVLDLTPVPTGYIGQSLSIADASFRVPVAKGWNLLGRWQYSTNFNTTLDAFAGFERETCCWRFSLVGRRFINNPATGSVREPDYNYGFFVQLELKGLGRLGDQVDNFLERSISGYRAYDY